MKRKINNLRTVDFRNNASSTIGHSGNSDVDVDVTVDTTPIAYAMLCTLLSSKQISSNEFNNYVRKLENLPSNGKSPTIREINDLSQVKLYKSS